MIKLLGSGFGIVLSLAFSSVSLGANVPSTLPEKGGPQAFVEGYRTIKVNCLAKSEPASVSSNMFVIKSGRKVWMRAMDSQWLMATTKNNVERVYIPRSCVK